MVPGIQRRVDPEGKERMGGKGKEKETKEGEGDRPRIACSGGPGSNPLYSICLPRIMSLPLGVIRLLGFTTLHDSRRYAIPRCLGPSHPDTNVRLTGDDGISSLISILR